MHRALSRRQAAGFRARGCVHGFAGEKREEGKQMNASVAIQVLPKVAESEETVRIVDAVIAYIRSQNVHMEVDPFETVMEGDYDQLMEIVKNCQQICIDAGAPSVMSYVKINYAPKGVMTMEFKTGKHRKADKS